MVAPNPSKRSPRLQQWATLSRGHCSVLPDSVLSGACSIQPQNLGQKLVVEPDLLFLYSRIWFYLPNLFLAIRACLDLKLQQYLILFLLVLILALFRSHFCTPTLYWCMCTQLSHWPTFVAISQTLIKSSYNLYQVVILFKYYIVPTYARHYISVRSKHHTSSSLWAVECTLLLSVQ